MEQSQFDELMAEIKKLREEVAAMSLRIRCPSVPTFSYSVPQLSPSPSINRPDYWYYFPKAIYGG